MARPTMQQVHIDKAMTNISIAYRNDNYIAPEIFPVVPVQHMSDQYFVFTRGDWFRNDAGLRAPGTAGPVVDYELDSETYACRPISAMAIVPDEIVANADSPLQPRREATEYATDKVQLFAEIEVAANVFGTGWASSATPSTTWDSDASDPIGDVETGKEAVVKAIGREPNVMVVGREVWSDIKDHPDLLDRIKYTSTGRMTPQLASDLFGIEKFLVGNGIKNTGEQGATDSFDFIWGKHAWLGYVAPRPGLMQPSAGYLFTWKNRVVKRIRMALEEADAIRVQWHYDDKVTSTYAGYLVKSCSA